jgi:hypothetical protein
LGSSDLEKDAYESEDFEFLAPVGQL